LYTATNYDDNWFEDFPFDVTDFDAFLFLLVEIVWLFRHSRFSFVNGQAYSTQNDCHAIWECMKMLASSFEVDVYDVSSFFFFLIFHVFSFLLVITYCLDNILRMLFHWALNHNIP
jgi:hypothetical protein